MRRMKSALVACAGIAAACSVLATHEDSANPALALAAAERAFAAHSVRENARAAFLANFASDGMVVRNGWTRAMPALEAQAPAPIVLDWHPVYVEAARGGDLGLSTGPWTVTPGDPAKHEAHGQFVSVWGNDGGGWKVLADIGIAHPEAALQSAPLVTRVAMASDCAARLEQAERGFAAAASRHGVQGALREFAAADLRFYREGRAPRLGREAALESGATGEAIRYSVLAVRASRSGGLGFAYGSYSAAAHDGAWLRVWRCEHRAWRVALDVTNAAR
jgi:hypothetical protein